jgi:hypothetical protein
MSTNDIDELKRQSDQAEAVYQEAMRARRDAVTASQEAARAAAKARSRYQRALGTVQVEEGADVGA